MASSALKTGSRRLARAWFTRNAIHMVREKQLKFLNFTAIHSLPSFDLNWIRGFNISTRSSTRWIEKEIMEQKHETNIEALHHTNGVGT
jgi:hypothetical protein